MEQITAADLQAALQPSCPSRPNVELSESRAHKEKIRFMEIAREVCPGFSLEEHQKPIVNEIFRWCMRLPGALDLGKGIWLWGDIGSGKSTLMKIIDRFVLYRTSLGADPDFLAARWMNIISADNICDAYAKEGIPGIERIRSLTRLCIDDVGTDNKITSFYGTPLNVVGNLILHRYEQMQRNDMMFTFATTNIGPSQVEEVYGQRVYDRVGEMFNFIQFSGYTHRPSIKSL